MIFESLGAAQPRLADTTIAISGYLDAYYCYDLNQPTNHERASFLYNFSRHDEIAVNLAFARVRLVDANVRANLSWMTGTYADANLASELPIWRSIMEANAGIRLSRDKDLWLDVGIMPSHIGFEGVVSKDCWTLTRSILAECSPYYEAGARLVYASPTNDWVVAAYVLNGWQQIEPSAGTISLSGGTLVTYQPNSSILFNSSTFIGAVQTDSIRRMRYFHNFFVTFPLTPSLGATLGIDAGIQQRPPDAARYNAWFGSVFILRYLLSNDLRTAGRLEYYQDKHRVVVSTGTHNGLDVLGASWNLDYDVTSGAMARIEARVLKSVDSVFPGERGLRNRDVSLTTSLAVSF